MEDKKVNNLTLVPKGEAPKEEAPVSAEEQHQRQIMMQQMQQQRIDAYKAELDRVDLLISWRNSISGDKTHESKQFLPSIDTELSEILLLLKKNREAKEEHDALAAIKKIEELSKTKENA